MSKIKHLIKRLIPQRIWGFLAFKKFTLKYFKYFKYDFNRYSKHSAAFFQADNAEKYLNLISVYTHILEKGLVMPDMRIGFGQVKVLGIIKICEEYLSRYNQLDPRLINCIAVIKEYQELHNKEKYVFPEFFNKTLTDFLDKFPTIEASQQLEFNKNDYFKHTSSEFKTFAKSRHSLREFAGKIDLNSIIKAIDLANTSPSACNRQSQKVYIIKETKLKESLLSIHVGSSGFGQMADSFLVITYSLSFWKDYTDRNAGFFDTGMFAMNLLYALHYYKIGACILNSYFTFEQDAAFRAELNINENENISCIIAIGGVPDNFKIALSDRISAESIIIER